MIIDNPSISGSISFVGGTNTISATTVNLTGSLTGTFEGSFSTTANANISGAFDSVSSSLASRIASNEGSVDSLNQASSSYALQANVSGAFDSVSSSLSSRIASNEGSVNSLNQASSSYLLNTSDTLVGDLTVTGTITAQEFHTEFVSASIVYTSGSTKFGDTLDDKHSFTGSLQVSGSSHYVLGNVGIGTSSPSTELTVVGNIKAGYESATGLILGLTPSSVGIPNNNVNAFILWGDNATFGGNNGDLLYIPRTSTTGEHRFYTANTGLASEKMRITYDGNVGIGTTSPTSYVSRFIEVSNATSAGIKLTSTSGLNSGMSMGYIASDKSFRITNYESTGVIRLETQDTERMRIDSSGNVGIGGTRLTAYGTSFRTLSIQTPAGDYASILELAGNRDAGDGNQNAMIQFWNKTSTAVETARISGNQASAVNSGNLAFYTALSGTLAERMSITSGGNVLIGTTSDSGNKFEIRTSTYNRISSYFSGDYTSGFKFSDLNGGIYYDAAADYLNVFTDYVNGKIAFSTAGSERVRITNTGNVGIGTTSPVNTYSGLTISGTDPSLALKTTSASGWVWTQYVNSSGTNNFSMGVNQTIPYWGVKAGAGLDSPNLAINSSGNVGIGTTSPATHLHVSSATHTKLRVGTTGVADASVEILGYDGGVHIGDPINGNRWAIWNDGASTSSSLKIGSYALGTWYADSAQAMAITSNGNVGIGIANPTEKLHIYHGSGNGPEVKLQNSSTTYFVRAYTDRLNFLAFDGASTYSEGISIKASNGYVGVGNTSPDYRLDVNGPAKVNRSVTNWYQGGSDTWSGYQYLHLKTNLYGGASPTGNIDHTMSLFYGKLYSYSSAYIREGYYGFHNWSGILYNPVTTGTFWSAGYMASDGYVVLVVALGGGSYLGVSIDWHQAYPYTFRPRIVTDVTASNSSSGVY